MIRSRIKRSVIGLEKANDASPHFPRGFTPLVKPMSGRAVRNGSFTVQRDVPLLLLQTIYGSLCELGGVSYAALPVIFHKCRRPMPSGLTPCMIRRVDMYSDAKLEKCPRGIDLAAVAGLKSFGVSAH
jgi:hypothetical protein